MKKNNLYRKHVFVCTNERNSESQQSCGKIGSELRFFLKQEMAKRGLNKEIRINKSGCLGQCSKGPCYVIYPNQEWHFNIDMDQSDKILNEILE
jgi:(2Fe-2S) ferredoxin|tara:strand:+ start:326 stop:607 length:282 start_codon:yes stop_codon:yes gene_type:complete